MSYGYPFHEEWDGAQGLSNVRIPRALEDVGLSHWPPRSHQHSYGAVSGNLQSSFDIHAYNSMGHPDLSYNEWGLRRCVYFLIQSWHYCTYINYLYPDDMQSTRNESSINAQLRIIESKRTYMLCALCFYQDPRPLTPKRASYSYEDERCWYGHDILERKRNRSLDQRPGEKMAGRFL